MLSLVFLPSFRAVLRTAGLAMAVLAAAPSAATTPTAANLCPRALAGTVGKDRWLTRSADGETVHLERLPDEGPWIPGLLGPDVARARREFLRRGLIVDAETVGLVAPLPLEIALIPFLYDIRDGRIARVLTPYVATQDPEFPLPDFTVRLTGLTDALVRGTRFDRDRLTAEFAKSDLIISHNAEFDRPIFDKLTAESAKKPWACSMQDIQWYQKGFPSRGLEALVLRHGFWAPGHRALADARQTLRLLATEDRLTTFRPYMAELRDAALRKDREFAVTAPYAFRPQLKLRGYGWDRRRRLWALTVPESDADGREREEREWYDKEKATSRDRGFKSFEVRTLTAVDRYRADVIELPSSDGNDATGIEPPSPLPSRATALGGNAYALRRVAPLKKVDPEQIAAWRRLHRNAVPSLLVRAVATGRDRKTDELVELALIPLLVDEATGHTIAVQDPYHGFQAPKTPLSAKAKERLGLDETVLAGHSFDLAKVAKWLGLAKYVFAYDAGEERPWVDALPTGFNRKRIWVSLKGDVDWSARGDVKTFFEPLFARHGFFVEGPDALGLATGLLETLRTEDTGVAQPLVAALERANGVFFRVAVVDGPRDASDTYRAEGLRFHAPSKTWERLVDGAAASAVVQRLRRTFPQAQITAEALQPHERYQERE